MTDLLLAFLLGLALGLAIRKWYPHTTCSIAYRVDHNAPYVAEILDVGDRGVDIRSGPAVWAVRPPCVHGQYPGDECRLCDAEDAALASGAAEHMDPDRPLMPNGTTRPVLPRERGQHERQ